MMATLSIQSKSSPWLTSQALLLAPLWWQAVQHCSLSMNSILTLSSMCLLPLLLALLWRQAVQHCLLSMNSILAMTVSNPLRS